MSSLTARPVDAKHRSQDEWGRTAHERLARRSGKEKRRLREDLFIDAIQRWPGLTKTRLCELCDCTTELLRQYLEDPIFARRYNAAEVLGRGDGPPKPEPLEAWRATYVNVEDFNPATGRRVHVGVTHDFQRPLVADWSDPNAKFTMDLWPVRFGKTTIAEHGIAHDICENPQIRILLISASKETAAERVANVATMLSDSEMYPELHARWGAWVGKPDGRGKPWSTYKLTVRGRRSAQRDPTLAAYGSGSRIYGKRADLIVLDDIDSPEFSDDVRAKIVKIIKGTIRTRLNEGGRVRYIGTRCGPNDVATQLMEQGHWRVRVLSSLGSHTEACSDIGCTPDCRHDQSLCPEMYSDEELRALRDEDPITFALMCQNNPDEAQDLIFPLEMIEYSKGAFGLCEAPEDWHRLITVDPATVGRAAAHVLAYDPQTLEIRAVDAEVRTNPREDGMLDMLARLVARNAQIALAVIESQGGSADPTEGKVGAFFRDEGIPVHPFHTGDNKRDPRSGLTLVATQMFLRKFRIAWGDPTAQKALRPLVDDMIAYKGQAFTHSRRFDALMSVWFGVHFIVMGRRRERRAGGKIRDPLGHKHLPAINAHDPQALRRAERRAALRGQDDRLVRHLVDPMARYRK